jgi:hypothetical protein
METLNSRAHFEETGRPGVRGDSTNVSARIQVSGFLLALCLAGCGGGGAPNSSPPLKPPQIDYGGTAFTLTTKSASSLAPSNKGGPATSWTVSPALPPGLTFSSATGAIAGTPSAPAAPAVYTVTARNSAGAGSVQLNLRVQAVLVDLGHTYPIFYLSMSRSAVLSKDVAAHWVIWDYATGAIVQQGSSCDAEVCVPGAELGGMTAVIGMPGRLDAYSAVTGDLLGSVPTIPTWWHVASDGSYICGGTASRITAWAPSGAVIASRAGDYSKSQVVCRPGSMLVAMGPAGATLIETVSLPSGSSSIGPRFAGTFSSWFVDGSAFLTNTNESVWVYSSSTALVESASLPTINGLAGDGSWYWTHVCSGTGSLTVTIYGIGSGGSPAASYTVPSDDLCQVDVTGTGLTIGVADAINDKMRVIDLSGATPVDAEFALPPSGPGRYAAVSNSQWVVGNYHGVLLAGPSGNGTLRNLNFGQAWSIAGSATRVAMAAASGQTAIFDTGTWQLEQTLSSSNSQVELSSDGTVLAARASADQFPSYSLDASVRVYSLPSGTLTSSWPYAAARYAPTNPWPVDITLSASGRLLGQVIYTGGGSQTYTREVTSSSRGPSLWSDSVSDAPPAIQSLPVGWPLPIRLSDDDTLIAVSNSKDNNASTNIYLNDVLATTVPGWAVGWLPANSILVNLYTPDPEMPFQFDYAGSASYTAVGLKQHAPSLDLGESGTIQVTGADSVFNPGTNAIYSLATGMLEWEATGARFGGAVAGTSIVFASGTQVVAQPY